MFYDDGRVACDDKEVRLRGYYFPWGTKRIAYTAIHSYTRRPMGRLRGQLRIWGSGDLVHWYNLDPKRTTKDTAFELRTRSRIRPVVTPDDPDAFENVLAAHVARD